MTQNRNQKYTRFWQGFFLFETIDNLFMASNFFVYVVRFFLTLYIMPVIYCAASMNLVNTDLILLIIWMSRTMQQLWTGCRYSMFCNFCENSLYKLEEMNSVLTNWSSNWIASINFNTFRRKSDWIIEYPFQPTEGFWIFLITIFLFWREKV